MRSVPLLALEAGLAGIILAMIAGCGGTGSTPTSSTMAVPAPATAANSGPAGSGNSSPAAPGPSATGPAPAPAGTTISGIEQMSDWDSCDTCAGGGTIAYSMTPGLSYPQPGTTQFSLGQGMPWANALWWKRL